LVTDAFSVAVWRLFMRVNIGRSRGTYSVSPGACRMSRRSGESAESAESFRPWVNPWI